MRLTKINESFIVRENISIRRFASPVNGIDGIRTLITIVYPLFITHHFFTCIDKRNSLRSKDYRLCQFIKSNQLFGSSSRHTCLQSVYQTQTIMTGNIANHLGRLFRPWLLTIIYGITAYLRMLNSSNNSEFYAHFSPRHSGKESSFVLLPYRSTKSIAQFIRKHSNSGHVGNISFHRQ